MKLRIRSRSGVSDIDVDPSISLAALKTHLGSDTLRSGFPPRPLAAADATPIADLLRNGDLIVVQSDAPPPSSLPAAAATTTTAAAIAAAPVASAKVAAAGAKARAPQPPPSLSTPSSGPPSSSIASQGKFHVREVPDDNSCLFRSVAHLLSAGATPASLRRVVAERVLSSPHEYPEVVLGRAPSAYAQWVRSDNAWGGAIELQILASHARVQLAAFDVQTMRLDHYPHDAKFETVAYLVYDGIHYNYAALSVPAVGDVTQFDPKDEFVLDGVRSLAQTLHDKKQYTSTGTFKLRCLDCGEILVGEKAALEHMRLTGHTNFEEVK